MNHRLVADFSWKTSPVICLCCLRTPPSLWAPSNPKPVTDLRTHHWKRAKAVGTNVTPLPPQPDTNHISIVQKAELNQKEELVQRIKQKRHRLHVKLMKNIYSDDDWVELEKNNSGIIQNVKAKNEPWLSILTHFKCEWYFTVTFSR